MLNKKNLPLIIALCIPVLMIILVAGFIYLPGIGKKPTHNFLYITGNDSTYESQGVQYLIRDGYLVKNQLPTTTPPAYPYPPKISTGDASFYVYDVTKNISFEITFEQARKYKLDPSNKSSDGYVLERGQGGDFPFGGSSDYNSWFIKGYNRSVKLNLKLVGVGYYDFQFLGWVE